jgi:cytochrome c oxidase subunit 4
MSQDNTHNHTVPYKLHVLILLALLGMTAISVAITQIHLGTLTVVIALLLATFKASLVLTYFMHLKFDNKFYALMVVGVIILIGIIIIITFLDYLYR